MTIIFHISFVPVLFVTLYTLLRTLSTVPIDNINQAQTACTALAWIIYMAQIALRTTLSFELYRLLISKAHHSSSF